MEHKDVVHLPAPMLKDFAAQAMEKCGLVYEDALLVSDTLVRSDLRGVASHGIVRLPFYCKRLIDKGSNPSPRIEIVAEKPALILIDGDNGLGQVVSAKAMEMVMERAESQGICFAGVKNSCHFGMAAYYPMMALARGMIGLTGSNTAPVMAPWRGGKAAIGNNPLAVAVPTGKAYPLVLDMAMSVVSGGKVRLEALKGTKIPRDWILDGQGRPTDNPADFFPHGTLLPLGHKGFGLAVMIEILAGILTKAAILKEINLWFDKTSQPTNIGHFFMALDIGTFLPLSSFKERVDELIDELKGSPLAEGATEIFLPGEIEYIHEQNYLKNGIPMTREVLESLNELALRLGIENLPWKQ